MFTIEISDDLDGFLRDHETWNRLASGIPFRETAWLGSWWRAFGSEKAAHVVVARDETGSVRGLLPLYRQNDRGLAMIGDGAACTDHVSVLADPADAEAVAQAMGEYLAKTAGDSVNGWESIDIDGVVEGDAAMTALVTALKANGANIHAQSRMSVWIRPADSNWDEHLARHGKTQRRQMRRWSEQLQKLEKVVAQTEVDVDTLLGQLIDMHQRRWIEAGEEGSYACPKFRDFIVKSAKAFLSVGRLHLAVIYLESTPIGGELRFIGENGFLYCYSSGYDIAYAEHEPGRVMCIEGILEMYKRGLKGMDFMRGDETYKSRHATESRRLFHVRAVAPTLMPRLRHAAWSAGFELKQWARKSSGRPVIDVQDLTSIGSKPPIDAT